MSSSIKLSLLWKRLLGPLSFKCHLGELGRLCHFNFHGEIFLAGLAPFLGKSLTFKQKSRKAWKYWVPKNHWKFWKTKKNYFFILSFHHSIIPFSSSTLPYSTVSSPRSPWSIWWQTAKRQNCTAAALSKLSFLAFYNSVHMFEPFRGRVKSNNKNVCFQRKSFSERPH